MLYGHRKSSFVIRSKKTKEVIGEFFDRALIEKLNTDKYEHVEIIDYLTSLNAR